MTREERELIQKVTQGHLESSVTVIGVKSGYIFILDDDIYFIPNGVPHLVESGRVILKRAAPEVFMGFAFIKED